MPLIYLDFSEHVPAPGVRMHKVPRYMTAAGERIAKRAVAKADSLLLEGQIGLYENGRTGTFLGYAIKYPGQPAYFEPAKAEGA